MNWWNFLFTCEIYIMLVLASNLAFGQAGQASFAQGAFFGAGAYTAALLMHNYDWHLFAAMPVAMVENAFLGWVLGVLAVRTRGLYFTLASIAVQSVIAGIIYNADWLTKGSYGLAIEHPLRIGLWQVQGSSVAYSLIGAFFLLMFWFFNRWLRHTPFLRTVNCMREDELGSVSIGKNPAYFKIWVNVLTGALMAVPAALYASERGFLSPEAFSLEQSILIVSMMLLGSIGGNKTGWLIGGAVFFVALPELVRWLPFGSDITGANFQMILYSLCLIFAARIHPDFFSLSQKNFTNR